MRGACSSVSALYSERMPYKQHVHRAKETPMTQTVTQRGVSRRDFMSSALAVGGAAMAAGLVGPGTAWGAVTHKPLDPVNPDILFGSTSSLWSGGAISNGPSSGS